MTVDLNWFGKKYKKEDFKDKDYKGAYSKFKGYYIGMKLVLAIEYPLFKAACLDKWGYRRGKMSNSGAREAELYMLITGITTHLTAITAYHVGRTDFMISPTAFSGIFLKYGDKNADKFLEQKS